MTKEGKEFKRLHNQMGEASPLQRLNIVAWLISTCLVPSPLCLHLGERALAPYVLTPCVYMQRQEQETNKQAMERKRCIGHVKEA